MESLGIEPNPSALQADARTSYANSPNQDTFFDDCIILYATLPMAVKMGLEPTIDHLESKIAVCVFFNYYVFVLSGKTNKTDSGSGEIRTHILFRCRV